MTNAGAMPRNTHSCAPLSPSGRSAQERVQFRCSHSKQSDKTYLKIVNLCPIIYGECIDHWLKRQFLSSRQTIKRYQFPTNQLGQCWSQRELSHQSLTKWLKCTINHALDPEDSLGFSLHCPLGTHLKPGENELHYPVLSK